MGDGSAWHDPAWHDPVWHGSVWHDPVWHDPVICGSEALPMRLRKENQMKKESLWIPEGLVAGLIGYVTVVVLFGAINLLAGEALFHTASLLGSALFFGARDASGLVSGPGPIIAYNGVHILVSLLIGVGAAWLIYQTEKNRPLWFVVFFVFLAGFIYSVALVGVLVAEVMSLLSWPAIVLANIGAGITAGGYLWWRHSGLLAELTKGE